MVAEESSSERLRIMSDMMKDIDKRNTSEMLGNIHIPSSSKEEEETTRPSDSPHLPKHRRNYTIFTEVRSDSMTQNSSAEELIREDQKSDFVRRHDHETEGTIKYVGWVYKQGAKSLFGIKMVRLSLDVRLKLTHTTTTNNNTAASFQTAISCAHG